MAALTIDHDDHDGVRSLTRSFWTPQDRANATPNPIRAHSLQAWSSRLDWELILGRLGFVKSELKPECGNSECWMWESRTNHTERLTAHDEYCWHNVKTIPTATGPRETFPPSITAYVDQERLKFDPDAELPTHISASKFDIVAALAYGGDWWRANRGEQIQWK